MNYVKEHNVPQSYRDQILKWNGWGYADSYFKVDQNGHVVMTGDKYEMCGHVLPNLRPWFEENLGVDLQYTTPSKKLSDIEIPPPIENDEIYDELKKADISFSNAPRFRLMRAHGHTVHDMIHLRNGRVPRLPDLVVWPRSEQEVQKVIDLAMNTNCAIIPIGGGTSVSNGLECPATEKRAVISLDMALMDKILWINKENLTCRAQAGIVGQSLERQLNAKGYTCGHEPDSIEFSTLGGWISTRASGMKKNKYGNIEDLVVHINFATAKGMLQKQCQVPRISSGPDLHHIIIGSEGLFGVVTEATIKIFPLPEVKRYGSLIFPNFSHGVAFFREVARQRIQPASLRLVDNEQFIMGQALKIEIDEICAATCVFEGSADEVNHDEQRLYALAEQYNGVVGGEENGKYGYRLTFAIAYLRDLGMEYGILGESFETSVAWDKVVGLCRNVKTLIKRESKKLGIQYPVLTSCRITQVYDAGACVYFYFGFNARGLHNGLEVYDKIETAARDEIIACGGSISHHHGIGKLRKQWMLTSQGAVGISLLKAIKVELDPANIFANANLVDIIGSPHSKL
ncbi:FAD linked oxidase protein [Dictyocaulus viviparus]|uniref:Alkylglycerone-phosphate synthase n=1 Tax=Dictyocaulus viviparus TaxID=29172 RepID=A0A0D8XA70_DICVI|nr:FAD linked oxidase protein [Dictyocaulus viviparus]